jgi:hypothetical protein
MNKICTTIEQSKKLLELGLNPSTADMCYNKINTEDFEYHLHVGGLPKIQASYVEYIPAWSLTALFILLPKEARLLKSATNDTYECDYPYAASEWYDNPLDAVFEAVCKLCENINIK